MVKKAKSQKTLKRLLALTLSTSLALGALPLSLSHAGGSGNTANFFSKVENLVSTIGTDGTLGSGSGKYIYFGEWPQTKVDENEVSGLNFEKVTDEYKGNVVFESNMHTASREATSGEVTARYAKVDEKDKDGSVTGSTYYKFEPIRWRIMGDKKDGKLTLIADSVIDYKQYNNVHKNTEEETAGNVILEDSSLMAWLSGFSDDGSMSLRPGILGGKESSDHYAEFYNLAFGKDEKSLLKSATISNWRKNDKVKKTTVTTAHVRIPTEAELAEAKYGFATPISRGFGFSAYAAAQKLAAGDNSNIAFVQSDKDDFNKNMVSSLVVTSGEVKSEETDALAFGGVLPVITLDANKIAYAAGSVYAAEAVGALHEVNAQAMYVAPLGTKYGNILGTKGGLKTSLAGNSFTISWKKAIDDATLCVYFEPVQSGLKSYYREVELTGDNKAPIDIGSLTNSGELDAFKNGTGYNVYASIRYTESVGGTIFGRRHGDRFTPPAIIKAASVTGSFELPDAVSFENEGKQVKVTIQGLADGKTYGVKAADADNSTVADYDATDGEISFTAEPFSKMAVACAGKNAAGQQGYSTFVSIDVPGLSWSISPADAGTMTVEAQTIKFEGASTGLNLIYAVQDETGSTDAEHYVGNSSTGTNRIENLQPGTDYTVLVWAKAQSTADGSSLYSDPVVIENITTTKNPALKAAGDLEEAKQEESQSPAIIDMSVYTENDEVYVEDDGTYTHTYYNVTVEYKDGVEYAIAHGEAPNFDSTFVTGDQSGVICGKDSAGNDLTTDVVFNTDDAGNKTSVTFKKLRLVNWKNGIQDLYGLNETGTDADEDIINNSLYFIATRNVVVSGLEGAISEPSMAYFVPELSIESGNVTLSIADGKNHWSIENFGKDAIGRSTSVFYSGKPQAADDESMAKLFANAEVLEATESYKSGADVVGGIRVRLNGVHAADLPEKLDFLLAAPGQRQYNDGGIVTEKNLCVVTYETSGEREDDDKGVIITFKGTSGTEEVTNAGTSFGTLGLRIKGGTNYVMLANVYNDYTGDLMGDNCGAFYDYFGGGKDFAVFNRTITTDLSRSDDNYNAEKRTLSFADQDWYYWAVAYKTEGNVSVVNSINETKASTFLKPDGTVKDETNVAGVSNYSVYTQYWNHDGNFTDDFYKGRGGQATDKFVLSGTKFGEKYTLGDRNVAPGAPRILASDYTEQGFKVSVAYDPNLEYYYSKNSTHRYDPNKLEKVDVAKAVKKDIEIVRTSSRKAKSEILKAIEIEIPETSTAAVPYYFFAKNGNSNVSRAALFNYNKATQTVDKKNSVNDFEVSSTEVGTVKVKAPELVGGAMFVALATNNAEGNKYIVMTDVVEITSGAEIVFTDVEQGVQAVLVLAKESSAIPVVGEILKTETGSGIAIAATPVEVVRSEAALDEGVGTLFAGATYDDNTGIFKFTAKKGYDYSYDGVTSKVLTNDTIFSGDDQLHSVTIIEDTETVFEVSKVSNDPTKQRAYFYFENGTITKVDVLADVKVGVDTIEVAILDGAENTLVRCKAAGSEYFGEAVAGGVVSDLKSDAAYDIMRISRNAEGAIINVAVANDVITAKAQATQEVADQDIIVSDAKDGVNEDSATLRPELVGNNTDLEEAIDRGEIVGVLGANQIVAGKDMTVSISGSEKPAYGPKVLIGVYISKSGTRYYSSLPMTVSNKVVAEAKLIKSISTPEGEVELDSIIQHVPERTATAGGSGIVTGKDKVTVFDISIIMEYIAAEGHAEAESKFFSAYTAQYKLSRDQFMANADVDGDGKVTIFDVSVLMEYLVSDKYDQLSFKDWYKGI